ncbi:MAG: hypothetical protein IKH22_00255 [Prevotella sp.]|nr:hypothetical protein [Prevotella sp.]
MKKTYETPQTVQVRLLAERVFMANTVFQDEWAEAKPHAPTFDDEDLFGDEKPWDGGSLWASPNNSADHHTVFIWDE